MTNHKYPLPEFLEKRCELEAYHKWLHRRAQSLVKRDRKRWGKKLNLSAYKEKIHEAVIQSKGIDFYSGKELD